VISKDNILTESQLTKVGNAIIYISNHLGALTKTHILKLLYLLDEKSIVKSGIPFFNLNYKVWKFGPVQPDLYYDLTDDINLLSKFIHKTDKFRINGYNSFEPIANFSDDEFTDNEIKLMNEVINYFQNHNSSELVDYTHQDGSLWKKTALKFNCFNDFEGRRNTTDIDLDMKELILNDEFKLERFNNYQEMF